MRLFLWTTLTHAVFNLLIPVRIYLEVFQNICIKAVYCNTVFNIQKIETIQCCLKNIGQITYSDMGGGLKYVILKSKIQNNLVMYTK